jgi:large subunit ribosomal protein L20
MPRVKRGVTAHKKHKKVLQRTQGHYGARHRLIKTAHESMMHSLMYAYRDTRINAAARMCGMRYSELIRGLALANVAVDRKIMSDLAVTDLAAFSELVKTAEAALLAEKSGEGGQAR